MRPEACIKSIRILTLSSLLVILTHITCAQKQQADSLRVLLDAATEDSTRCDILNALIEVEFDDKIWPGYNEKLRKLSEANLKNYREGTHLHWLYTVYLANAIANAGWLDYQRGSFEKSLQEINAALNMREKINDKGGIANCYNNLGFIYIQQGENEKGLEYYLKGLKIQEETGNKKGIAGSLSNIAAEYMNAGKLEEARTMNERALQIYIELNTIDGIARTYNNIGGIHSSNGNIAAAFEAYKKCLHYIEQVNDPIGTAATLGNLGNLCLKQNKIAEARSYAGRALEIGKTSGYPHIIRNAAKQLNSICERLGDYTPALDYMELYIQMRDSVANEQTRKASIKNQLKYEYEKKAAADSVKREKEKHLSAAQLAASSAKVRREKMQIWFLSAGIVLVIAGFIFVGSRFRVTQKQKKIIQEQKQEIDQAYSRLTERNKEILDSIHYARRIQYAIISSERYIEKQLRKLSGKD